MTRPGCTPRRERSKKFALRFLMQLSTISQKNRKFDVRRSYEYQELVYFEFCRILRLLRNRKASRMSVLAPPAAPLTPAEEESNVEVST